LEKLADDSKTKLEALYDVFNEKTETLKINKQIIFIKKTFQPNGKATRRKKMTETLRM